MPAATMVAVLPETVHTAGAVLAKVTGSTDDAANFACVANEPTRTASR